MASTKWVVDRVVDLLRDNPSRGAKDLQEELNKKHHINIPYFRRINGKWDDSYDLLPTYREELLRSVPSSLDELDELDSKECNGDVCFTRFSIALKPYINRYILHSLGWKISNGPISSP
uniref:Uncharacterized protein n=1 Tax=Oryza meridionalis TaxID=40149 RepID=A0A0E0CUE6_9ORYZ